VQGFAVMVVLTMSALLVRYGIDLARLNWSQTSPTMEWSMGYLYLVVPVSGALMFVFALEHLVHIVRGQSLPSHGAGHSPPPDKSPSTSGDTRQEQWL
jgi:TRAP-type C4-dicarboxylate transport system permease small subunit